MKKAAFKKAAIIVVVIAVGVTVVAAKTTSRKKTVSDNIPQTRTESAYDFTNGESLPETVEKFVGNIKNALNIKKDNLKPNKGQKTAEKGENVYFDEEIGLAANEFKVIFKNYNGETLKTDIVKKGEAATPPKTPERKGYVFVGWDRTFNSIEFDVIVNAVFEKIKEPTIIADRVDCIPGQKKVGVNISLMNNPGISSLNIKVAYDNDLVLTEVKYNGSLVGQSMKPGKNESPVTLTWVSPFENMSEDCMFATLFFDVSEEATGDLPISITYDMENIYNMEEQNIYFDVVNGAIAISE